VSRDAGVDEVHHAAVLLRAGVRVGSCVVEGRDGDVRSGAAAGHRGFFHETAFYGSDDEYLHVVRPFVQGGLDAGEPTFVACNEANEGLIRDAIGEAGITFLPGGDQYTRPGPTIRSYRELFEHHVSEGAQQIRVVGDVPHIGTGADWLAWVEYEAAINVAFDDFPLWGLCPYDTRVAPPEVMGDVACTHPNIATDDGEHHENRGFVEPRSFLDERLAKASLPTDHLGEPHVHLADVTPREARHELLALAQGRLRDEELDALALVTSELVTNAHQYGEAPVHVRGWLDVGCVRAEVSDGGHGPQDPLAGWAPPGAAVGGHGIWIARQLCAELRQSRRDGYRTSFTIGALQETSL
jgi:anti-sigma regulatory factor (Ser/Thr protein kinase)